MGWVLMASPFSCREMLPTQCIAAYEHHDGEAGGCSPVLRESGVEGSSPPPSGPYLPGAGAGAGRQSYITTKEGTVGTDIRLLPANAALMCQTLPDLKPTKSSTMHSSFRPLWQQ